MCVYYSSISGVFVRVLRSGPELELYRGRPQNVNKLY